MKNKKFLYVMLSLFCALFLCACQSYYDAKFVATTKTIYNFYQSNLLSAQTALNSDVNKVPFTTSQSAKITKIVNDSTKIEQEELAIVASVECYNINNVNKEIYINYKDGGLISVKQVNRNYFCDISLNGIHTEYSFTISKDNTTNEYLVKYSKEITSEIKECSSKVFFDKDNSRLYISVSSYDDETLEPITVSKDFYLLSNNHTALRLSVSIGSGNNKSLKTINTYKEIENYSIKASSVIAIEDKFNNDNLALDKIVKTSANEKCGFIAKYNSKNASPEVSEFGEEQNW